MADINPSDLIRNFIEDEDAAIARSADGRFWPSNHHRIRPLTAKAGGLMEASERVAFYFHFLRCSGDVPVVSDKELPLLVEAYERLVPFLDEVVIARSASRLALLYVFGFDEAGTLSGGKIASAEELKRRLKTLTQATKYTSLPAQRAKRTAFAPLADEAPRLLETLRHLGYRHDRRYPDSYDTVNLRFWGMVLIVLSNAQTRPGLLGDMLDGTYEVPQREKHLGSLHKTVAAILPDCGPEETAFHALVERLAAREAARREQSEAVILARTLGLGFDDDEDWAVQISLAEEGSGRSALLAPNLVLHLRPDPDNSWHIAMNHSERGRFSEWDGRIAQNDPRVGGLGAGNLSGFPAWLRNIRAESGLSFDLETVDIRARRNRVAAKLLKQWLCT